MTEQEREAAFLAKVVPLASGCWLWTGARNPEGYGRTGAAGRKVMLAHRWAYEHWVGPIPAGAQLDHTCHHPGECAGGKSCLHRACVNPHHLEPVDALTNTRRAMPWINGQRRRTHCPQGHPYDEENTRVDGRGSRHCRTCDFNYRRTRPSRAHT